MKERALKIGNPTPIAAIATDPENFDANKPAVLILNSGVMHHIGTCRISVKIARSLAKQGYLVVRFDFSGIGDSAPRRGTDAFAETSVREITEVMDYIEKRRGVKKFIAYGLCSGADASYEIAQKDERIVGMAQIDPYSYRTPAWYWIHYAPRFLKLGPWVRFIQRKLGGGSKSSGTESDNNLPDQDEFVEMPSYIREFPPRAEVARNLQTIVNRGTFIYSIFSGGGYETLNHQTQFTNSMKEVDFKGLLTVDYFADMEHIVTEPEYQKMVPERLCQWVDKVYQSHPAFN